MGTPVLSMKQVYQILNAEANRFGEFKKCEMHLHTPASYDYELIKGKEYHILSESEVCKYAMELGFLNEDRLQQLKGHFNENTKNKKEFPFDSFKEFVAFGLVAYKLYQESIDLVTVCDHNTINGYRKLAYVLEYYYETRVRGVSNQPYVDVLLGVEISCSDKNHLIVILNNNQESKVKKYLEEILLNDDCREGTYIDSRTLIEIFNKEFDSITYIAHINTSNLAGSGAYNKALFNSKDLKLLGVNDGSKINSQRLRIHEFAKGKEFSFILESDAHTIEDIGKKNTWIKFQRKDFKAFQRAVRNRNICLRITKPNKVDRYIRGLLVIPEENGFLAAKNKGEFFNSFYVALSQDLNCIIGGRGTGKSTILKTIEIALTREVANEEELDCIANNKIIYCLFDSGADTYMVTIIPQVNNDKGFYVREDKYKFIYKVGDKIRLGDEWINLFKYKNNEFVEVEKAEIDIVLNRIFRRAYDINDLVSKVTQGKINAFIRNVVTYGVKYDGVESYESLLVHTKTRGFSKTLRENLASMIEFISKRRNMVEESIHEFNEKYENVLRIVYSPKLGDSIEYIQYILENFDTKRNVASTYLTGEDIQLFIKDCTEKIGYLVFLKLLLNDKYREIEKINNIQGYQREIKSFYQVEQGLEKVTSKNIKRIYKVIKDKILEDRVKLQKSILQCLRITDDFTILFNINHRESNTDLPCIMKDIQTLSLGQKVVALLTFVFDFGLTNNDNTPLIIDQPEDNLDNQYIYKNLVTNLKMVKSSRQVIIATHSSTIVTNADAEQVIVMESDNEKGWILKKGYPSDRNIIKHIINYMEGGVESFCHKKDIYGLYIKV